MFRPDVTPFPKTFNIHTGSYTSVTKLYKSLHSHVLTFKYESYCGLQTAQCQAET
jgi:hypothetical protein